MIKPYLLVTINFTFTIITQLIKFVNYAKFIKSHLRNTVTKKVVNKFIYYNSLSIKYWKIS